jgi:hypothetical protein
MLDWIRSTVSAEVTVAVNCAMSTTPNSHMAPTMRRFSARGVSRSPCSPVDMISMTPQSPSATERA